MNNYDKLFASLDTPEAPAGLARKILVNIERRERRFLVVKMVISALVFVSSLGVIAVGYINLVADLQQSGFFQLFSLFFSDFSSVISNLPDFGYSIIESFPLFSAAIVLGGVAFAIASMAAFLDETTFMQAKEFTLMQ